MVYGDTLKSKGKRIKQQDKKCQWENEMYFEHKSKTLLQIN